MPVLGELLAFLEKAPKDSNIHIIGGGILGDMGAFACALRGLPFTLIPTTLLGMADACIGGKTGVNFNPYGKNQLGRFAFPSRVVLFPGWLSTLSERDYLSGVAECVNTESWIKISSHFCKVVSRLMTLKIIC